MPPLRSSAGAPAAKIDRQIAAAEFAARTPERTAREAKARSSPVDARRHYEPVRELADEIHTALRELAAARPAERRLRVVALALKSQVRH